MLSKIRFGLALSALLLVAACANSYNRIEMGGTERIAARLDEDAAVLVMTPRDGSNGKRTYAGSGAIVARRVDAAFSRYARLVDRYPTEYHSLNDLQDVIIKNGYGYIVVPTIVFWEQGGKDWSKASSQASVKISVIDAATGKIVSSNVLEAKGPSPSSLYNILDSDTDGPDELLSQLADDYADAVYGAILVFPHR